jgi:hypothetical protein
VKETAASAPDPRRALNDNRRSIFAGSGRLIAFVCECGDTDCTATVPLEPAEFDARRPGAILHPLHTAPGPPPDLPGDEPGALL